MIEQLKPYEVGKRYRIPCIQWSDAYEQWTPILGPLHSDKEHIGFDSPHWHIDFRFVSERQWRLWGSGYSGNSKVHGRVIIKDKFDGKVTIRRLVCRRLMPTFPTAIPMFGGRICRVTWIEKLEDAYHNQKLNLKCRTCPHRGLPLDGLPNVDGVVVCPGHGLAWNLKTGDLVRREARHEQPLV